MFILPFLLAGVFMLSVLEPRFTLTLLQQTISEAGLLLIDAPRRAASQYLLSQLPWQSTDDLWTCSYLPPTLPAASGTNSLEPPSDRACPFQMASSIWAAATPPTFRRAISTVMSVYSPVAAQILTFFLLVFFVRRICIWLVRYCHLPEPPSPALEFVEELHKQMHGQAFTPGTSQSRHSSCGRNEDVFPCSCEVASSSSIDSDEKTRRLDVGQLRGISGTPLALPSLVREANEKADLAKLQPAREALVEVPPASQTTRMDVLGWAPESMHAFIEEDFTNTSSSAREGSTFSLPLPDSPLTPLPDHECHNVILQPAPDTVERPRRFRSTKPTAIRPLVMVALPSKSLDRDQVTRNVGSADSV
ncbi:hypothetical protein LXA43DRAFT_694896 [Ganoderma leucocontextum]|nr:hypothetical protein LXA43DRAFT_694896 [Ganoderma leucocontextum]